MYYCIERFSNFRLASALKSVTRILNLILYANRFLKPLFWGFLLVFLNLGEVQGNEPHVQLTIEERAWIKAHPAVTVGVWDNPPAQFSDDGVAKGYRVEMMEAMLYLAGLQPDYRFSPLNGVIKGLREGSIDIGMAFFKTSERSEYLNYALHEFQANFAIFAQTQRTDISDQTSLRDKTIGSYKGYGLENALKAFSPGSPVVQADDVKGMLRLVATGEADFCVQEISSGVFHLQQEHLANVEPKGFFQAPGGVTKHSYDYVVRKRPSILTSILHKAEQSMDPEEKQHIWNRWYASFALSKLKLTMSLTKEEKAWLKQNHTIRVRIVEIPPFIKATKGEEPAGMSIDYLNLISDRTGIRFTYNFSTLPFSEALERMKNQEGPDLIMTMMRTPEREPFVSFSKNYLSTPRVIFTRADSEFISGIGDLDGKMIAVPRGTVVHEELEK